MPVAVSKELQQINAAVEEKERRELSRDFGKFFRTAWTEALEPHTELTDSPHYELLFEYAQLLGSGEFKKRFPEKKGLIINIPPRTLKSQIFNVALPAWVWSFAPHKRFLCISYGQTLAVDFSVKRRNLLTSPFYKKLWPKLKLRDDQDNKDNYHTSAGGWCICASPGSIGTGFGGNIVVIDDLLNAADWSSKVVRTRANNFFDESLSSRTNNPAEDVFLIVCQRLHQDDIVGHLTTKDPDEWLVVKIEMEAEEDTDYVFPISGKVWHRPKGDTLLPSRFKPRFIQGLKRTPAIWLSQYQQVPSPPGGFIFPPDAWRTYDPENKPNPEFQFMSVDCEYRIAVPTP